MEGIYGRIAILRICSVCQNNKCLLTTYHRLDDFLNSDSNSVKSITVPALWEKKSNLEKWTHLSKETQWWDSIHTLVWLQTYGLFKTQMEPILKNKKRDPWHPSLWGESPEALVSEGGEAGLALRSPANANLNWQVMLLLRWLWFWKNIMDLEWEQGTDAPMFRTEVSCLYWQWDPVIFPHKHGQKQASGRWQNWLS